MCTSWARTSAADVSKRGGEAGESVLCAVAPTAGSGGQVCCYCFPVTRALTDFLNPHNSLLSFSSKPQTKSSASSARVSLTGACMHVSFQRFYCDPFLQRRSRLGP